MMVDPVDRYVGERLRVRRQACGMSQAELGRAMGVRFQQVQKYETAINRIAASRLWHAAAALGVQPAYFFPPIADRNVGEGK